MFHAERAKHMKLILGCNNVYKICAFEPTELQPKCQAEEVLQSPVHQQ